MQTSVENYFWLVDRLNMEDDPANKVNVQKETVILSNNLRDRVRSGEILQKLLEQMHVTFIKRTEKPFSLKKIDAKNPQQRWNGIFS